MPQISVIVPIYRVEDCLRQCVDSVLGQSAADLEVILVDDGSPDGCAEICAEYAALDRRVKVIRQPNQGLAAARNTGIEAARGEYLAFVDADDWIDEDMLQLLLDACRRYDAQIAECSYRNIWPDRVENATEATGRVLVADPARAIRGMLDWTDFCTMAWNKLYHRSVIGNVRYPVGKLHEDEFTTWRFFANAQRLVYIDQPKYSYNRTRAGSIMAAPFRIQTLDACEAARQRRDALETWGDAALSESAANAYCWVLLDRLYSCWKAGLADDPRAKELLAQTLREAEYYRAHPVAPVYRKQLEFLAAAGLDAFGAKRQTGWPPQSPAEPPPPPSLWQRIRSRLGG